MFCRLPQGIQLDQSQEVIIDLGNRAICNVINIY